MFVNCSWIGYNAIIVTHLFELTFEFAPIVKVDTLRSRVMWQPDVRNQILDGCCWLIFGFDNFKPASDWIYHCECKQRVCFGLCPYRKWNHQIQTDHGPGIQSQILLFWMGSFHITCMFVSYFSSGIFDKWNINSQYSKSCIRPGRFIVCNEYF
jgi:hypothetical protein